jgi:hypothetical protein
MLYNCRISYEDFSFGRNDKKATSLKNCLVETDCHSPDRSGILFLAPLARKRYSGWRETASKINYYRLYLQFDIKH